MQPKPNIKSPLKFTNFMIEKLIKSNGILTKKDTANDTPYTGQISNYVVVVAICNVFSVFPHNCFSLQYGFHFFTRFPLFFYYFVFFKNLLDIRLL